MSVLRDIMTLAGLATLGAGVWLDFGPPRAMIVVGGILLLGGVACFIFRSKANAT